MKSKFKIFIFLFFLFIFSFFFHNIKSLEKVDINTAPIEELVKIIHIGEARANEIIKLRPFYSLDDLVRVKGIGEKSVEDIKKEGLAFVSEEINKPVIETSTDIKKESIIFKVDINTAPIEELVKIIHIGEARANEIIKLRPFYSLDDLVRVKGIGEKSVEDIKKEGLAFVDGKLEREKNEEKKEKNILEDNYKTASVKEIPSNVFLIALSISIFSSIIIYLLKKSLK